LTDEKIVAVCEAIAASTDLPKLVIKRHSQRCRSNHRRHRRDIADDLLSIAVLEKIDGANVLPET